MAGARPASVSAVMRGRTNAKRAVIFPERRSQQNLSLRPPGVPTDAKEGAVRATGAKQGLWVGLAARGREGAQEDRDSRGTKGLQFHFSEQEVALQPPRMKI